MGGLVVVPLTSRVYKNCQQSCSQFWAHRGVCRAGPALLDTCLTVSDQFHSSLQYSGIQYENLQVRASLARGSSLCWGAVCSTVAAIGIEKRFKLVYSEVLQNCNVAVEPRILFKMSDLWQCRWRPQFKKNPSLYYEREYFHSIGNKSLILLLTKRLRREIWLLYCLLWNESSLDCRLPSPAQSQGCFTLYFWWGSVFGQTWNLITVTLNVSVLIHAVLLGWRYPPRQTFQRWFIKNTA